MIAKTPRQFFKPLAIGAPDPQRDLPVRLERMIHFVPPHIEKVRAKVPEMAKKADVILGNLEDAIPADQKEAARAGFVEMAKATDFAALGTGLWSRVNSLKSPGVWMTLQHSSLKSRISWMSSCYQWWRDHGTFTISISFWRSWRPKQA